MIADLGLYTITIREIAKHKNNPAIADKIAGCVLSLRTFFGIAIIGLSTGLALFLPGYSGSPMAISGVFIAGIFTLFGLINSSILSTLQARLETEFSFISTTVGKLVNFIGILLVVYVIAPNFASGPTYGFILIMIAGLIGNLTMTVMLFIHARRKHAIRFHWDMPTIRHILTASIPYGLALFLNVIFFKIDSQLISVIESMTHNELYADRSNGLYGVAMKIVETGMMFGTLYLNSLLPLFAENLRHKAWPKIRELYQKSFRLLFFAGLSISMTLYVFAEEIVQLVATKSYLHQAISVDGRTAGAEDALRIVAFIFLFYFLSSLSTYLLIAHNEQKKLLKINALIAGLNIIGNALVIPYYSFIGSAWVTLLCQILLLILTSRTARKIHHTAFAWGFILQSTILASIASTIAIIIKKTID